MGFSPERVWVPYLYLYEAYDFTYLSVCLPCFKFLWRWRIVGKGFYLVSQKCTLTAIAQVVPRLCSSLVTRKGGGEETLRLDVVSL